MITLWVLACCFGLDAARAHWRLWVTRERGTKQDVRHG